MIKTMITAQNFPYWNSIPERDSRRGRRSHTRRQTCGSGVSPRIAAGRPLPQASTEYPAGHEH